MNFHLKKWNCKKAIFPSLQANKSPLLSYYPPCGSSSNWAQASRRSLGRFWDWILVALTVPTQLANDNRPEGLVGSTWGPKRGAHESPDTRCEPKKKKKWDPSCKITFPILTQPCGIFLFLWPAIYLHFWIFDPRVSHNVIFFHVQPHIIMFLL